MIIKSSLALLLALNINTGLAYNPDSHVNDIYNRIVRSNHISNAPRLFIKHTNQLDARTFPNVGLILITTGLINSTHNDDELAHVLGHELSHWVNRDHEKRLTRELNADRLGGTFEDRAGFNHCKGAGLLKRQHSPGDMQDKKDPHPPSDYRYQLLTRDCK